MVCCDFQIMCNLLSFRQKRVYSKKSKRYRVHTAKVAKDYSYIPQLQTKILKRRLDSAGGLPRRRTLRLDDPRALGLLPGVVPPPTAELARTQIPRGQVCQLKTEVRPTDHALQWHKMHFISYVHDILCSISYF